MRLLIRREDIGKGHQGQGRGLEIAIEGLRGDIAEVSPGTSLFIEYYNNKVQLHVWTDGVVDCQTIVLN